MEKREPGDLFEAIEFAARAHRGQRRKTSLLPYIYHPLAVGRSLLEAGCAEDVVVAGVLHDVVEDTSVSLAEVQEQFGLRVARWVEGASEPDKEASWEERKRHTLRELEGDCLEVLLVVCADKLDNLLSLKKEWLRLGEEVWGLFRRPREKQRWYYQSLADVLWRRLQGKRGEELARQVVALCEEIFGPLPSEEGEKGRG